MKHFFTKIRLLVTLQPQKIPLLVFIILSTTALIMQIVHYISDMPASPSKFCKQEQQEIMGLLHKEAACKEDHDCTISTLNCPFSCIPVNQNFDKSSLVKKIAIYNEKCGFCVESCTIAIRPSCIEGYCQLPGNPNHSSSP